MSTLFLNSIDRLLGDRDSRYFGEGYTASSQGISELRVASGNSGIEFSCLGSVDLPRNWSTKGSVHQTPHLSTIDVIELSIACLRSLMQKMLHGHDIHARTIRSIGIRAGNAPVEGDLTSIPMNGLITEEGDGVSALHLEIANMHVCLTFLPGAPRMNPVIGFLKQPISISDLLLDSDHLVASALLAPLEEESVEAWSAASCFAATAQLGQALLYEMDGIQRTESNTLWMKRTLIETTYMVPSFEARQPIHVKLESVRRYTKDDGDWQRADICGLVANLKIVCSVTHRLPERFA